MKMLRKIVSGGQTGVDQAALRTALELNFRIGGWCPPGRVCENGNIPTEYTLIETENERSLQAPDIPRSQRTEYNVRDSDATLLLKPQELKNDPGTGWTIQCAERYKKPLLIVDPYSPEAEKLISEWFKKTSVETVNIAGPGEGTSPGIGNQTYHLIQRVLIKMKSDNFYHDIPSNGRNG